MTDKKISELVAVTTVEDTDEFVLARAGASNKITGANLATSVGGGGSSAAVISETDPGAIGAGAFWCRIDPDQNYAPTLLVRDATDTSWVTDPEVGGVLGLTYYDGDGNVTTCFFGGLAAGEIVAPGGHLSVGGFAYLSGATTAQLVSGAAYVSVSGTAGSEQIGLVTGAATGLIVDTVGVQVNRLEIGTDQPLSPNLGALVIGPSNEITDGGLTAGFLGISYDNTNGAAKLKIKAKTADGTVVHGEIALT